MLPSYVNSTETLKGKLYRIQKYDIMASHVEEIKLCKEIDNYNLQISELRVLATDNRLNNTQRFNLEQKIRILEGIVQQKVHELDQFLLL